MSESFSNFDTSDLMLNIAFPPPSSWGNLGTWTGTKDYPTAARQLALRLGQAARIRKGSRICDIGFGCGDQLRVWREDFQVSFVWGLNPSRSQWAWAKRLCAKDLATGHLLLDCKSHEALTVTEERWDHIVALDCAYHFSQKKAFLRSARTALHTGGSLAMTDLVLGSPSRWATLLIRLFARLAQIPWDNLMSEARYRDLWEEAGFTTEIEDISAEVFPGIAQYLTVFIDRWGHSLSWKLKLRYQLTAKVAAWASQTGHLRYILVKGH